MRRLLTTTLVATALLLSATVFAQRYNPSTWRAIYVGQVGSETVVLDLMLGPGDFAFARMALNSSTVVLDGVGQSNADDEIWLQFRESEFRSPAGNAADYAYFSQQYDEGQLNPTTERLPLQATLTAKREVTWEDDGSTLAVSLTFMQAFSHEFSPALKPVTGTLNRVAQYAFVMLQQGRIDVGYAVPYFNGEMSMLNSQLEFAAADRQAQWVVEGRQIQDMDQGLGWAWTHHEDVELVGWAGPYRSFVNSFYYYTGGAHPNHHTETLLYRLDDGGFTELVVTDLFAPDSDWVAALSSLAVESLRQQDAAWVVDGEIVAFEAEQLALFTLGPAGLTFLFDTYEVGPYVQGDFAVTIGYEVLLPLAADNGVIATFAETYTGR